MTAHRTHLYATAHELADTHSMHVVGIRADKKPAQRSGWTERDPAGVTVETLETIDTGETHGVAVRMGPLSAPAGHALGAAELEGRAADDPTFMAELTEALETLRLTDLWRRMMDGWGEDTPSGGVRAFFYYPADDPADVKRQTASLPCRAARRDGATYAELLLTTTYTIVAPTAGSCHPSGSPWMRASGGPSTIVTITGAELVQLGELMAALSDVQPTATPGSIEHLSERTQQVRAAYNRRTTDQETQGLLEAEGWEVVKECESDEVAMERDGHARLMLGDSEQRPAGSLYMWGASAAEFEQGWYSAFDVLVALHPDPALRGDAEAVAAHLEETKAVRLVVRPLAPRAQVEVYPRSTPTTALAAQTATAIAQAQHPGDQSIPYVLRHEARDGEIVGLVTLARDGRAHRWTRRGHETLALSCVSPVTLKDGDEEDGKRTYLHKLPDAAMSMAIEGVETSPLTRAVHTISPTPVLTESGDPVAEPGYHPAHGVLLTIPRRERALWSAGYHVGSTRPEAQAALDTLVNLIQDFPFVTEGDRARAVAYLITCVVRDQVPTVPLTAFSAADRGTGKTLLASLGRLLAAGSPAATSIGYSQRHDEEIGKRVGAAALAGHRFLHCDEVPRDAAFTSLMVSELVTSEVLRQRILGTSEEVGVSGMVVTVAGNNLTLGGDLQRRSLPIALIAPGAQLAHERSSFTIPDLTRHVREHRPELVAAVHTIVRHGIRNPQQVKGAFGGFEAWEQLVVGGLVPLTIGGQPAGQLVYEGRDAFLDANDVEREEWLPLMEAILGLTQRKAMRTGELRKALLGMRPAVELPPALALAEASGDAGAVRAWGRALASRAHTKVRDDSGQILELVCREDKKRGNAITVRSHEPAASALAPLAPVVRLSASGPAPASSRMSSVSAQTLAPRTSTPAPVSASVDWQEVLETAEVL